MSVSLRKLEGIQAVEVTLKDGRARIQLKAGNALTLAQVRETIERNGFTPQTATATMRAEVVSAGGKLRLRVLGTNDTHEVQVTPHGKDMRTNLERYAGKRVVVEGLIPVPKGSGSRSMIQVTSVTPEASKS